MLSGYINLVDKALILSQTRQKFSKCKPKALAPLNIVKFNKSRCYTIVFMYYYPRDALMHAD